MKLSEYQGEAALDLLADLIEPAGEIMSDKHLGEVFKDKGDGAVDTCKGAEATLKILVGAQFDDFAIEGHDEADESHQHHGHHQSLHQQYPVASVGCSGIGEKGDAADDGGKHRHAHRPCRHIAAGSEVGFGGFLLFGEPYSHEYGKEHGDDDDGIVYPV